MAVFKCKMCGGGTVEFESRASIGVCNSCGTRQTLPHLDDERRANLYDRANHLRRGNEYDKAAAIYEQILAEDSSDAEAYWSLVLCRYGIEYVENPATHGRVPTVNRAQYTSILADEDYKSAIKHADGYQRSLYEEEARAIDEIQKGILAISREEKPFDVFICYKETDNNERRTRDSVLANDIYHQLTEEGFKVFFSRITLEDKLGTAYEPYIFAALNSAKVMIALGTKPEYFNAVWVKNEWSRYLAFVKRSDGKKVLIPAYRDMDPYDLPEEFSHLQAQDMSKLGFMQDLIRGVKKIASVDEPKNVAKGVGQGDNAEKASFLKRAFLFLTDGDWENANAYCEKVLDIDAECAEAYLYKLMAEMRVRKETDIGNQAGTIKHSNNYGKIMMFGSDELKTKLEEYDNSCRYNYAVSVLHDNNYESAKTLFEQLSEYGDSENKIAECAQKIEKEQAEKEKQKAEIENLRKENEQLTDKKEALNEKLKNQSSLPTWVGTISMFMLFISAIILFVFVIYDENSDISIPDVIFWGVLILVSVVGGVSVLGLIGWPIVKKTTSKRKPVISNEIDNIESAIQSNAATIRNYEKTMPLLTTFPDVISKNTNFQQGSASSFSNTVPSFLMTVSDTFFITGRGTVVTGTVSIGTIRVGDTVQIEGQQYQVLGIDAYRQTISSASAGMTIELLINSENVKFRQGTSVTIMAGSNTNTSWHDAVLVDTGTNKIQVIAAIRELTGLELAEVKAITDVVPSTVKRAVSADEADLIKSRLESFGARVDIR